MAGFFFCLAPVEGAGLLFCPAAIQPHTSVYSGFCHVYEVIPPTLQNSTQGFAGAFPAICPILPPQIPDQQKRIKCSLRHVGAYHSAAAPPAHTICQHHAGRCAGQNSRPIIIRYIKVQQCAPCYRSMLDNAIHCRPYKPGGGLDTSHARRLAVWYRVNLAPSTRRGSPAAGARNH